MVPVLSEESRLATRRPSKRLSNPPHLGPPTLGATVLYNGFLVPATDDGLAEVVHAYQPDEAAVEQTFVNKDAVATLKLGQARGIAMLVPARAGLQVAEYAPNAVKKAVIGVGHGEKQQIHMMLKILMPKAEFKGNDAADALAIAICHAHNRGGARMRMAALAG